jgi:release factor glutamine methyltransferase
MRTYRETYDEARARLTGSGDAEADLDARILLEETCGTDYGTLFTDGGREVTDGEYRRYTEWIDLRAAHRPVAYILGKQEFMGLPFRIDRHVLIPNQDTENLVEEAMKELHDGMRILDLCTGSGCILLSLLHYSNGCTGIGTDLSADALEVARGNGEALGLSDRAVFLQGDLFDALDGRTKTMPSEAALLQTVRSDNAPAESERPDGCFQMIVSNPPYIRSGEIETLAPEVKTEEPHMALDGGPDGLLFYRRIITGAPAFLAVGGLLLMEIGADEGEAVGGLLRDGGFLDVQVLKDYGGHDRVVRGECGLMAKHAGRNEG